MKQITQINYKPDRSVTSLLRSTNFDKQPTAINKISQFQFWFTGEPGCNQTNPTNEPNVWVGYIATTKRTRREISFWKYPELLIVYSRAPGSTCFIFCVFFFICGQWTLYKTTIGSYHSDYHEPALINIQNYNYL